MNRALVAVALAACGRVGFDAQRVGGDDAPIATGDVATDGPTLPAGPTLWLRMNTDPGTGIIDSAGGHVSACVGGRCPAAIGGLHAGGYHFGAEQIDVTYAADLDTSQGFTAALWVQLTAFPSPNAACPFNMPFNDANGWDTFAICIDGVGVTEFDSESPTGIADLGVGPAIGLDAWHHLAQTWDGTTKRGYLDGALVTTRVVAVGIGTQNPTVGSSRNKYYFTGTLDDVLYYPRVLSAAEVAQLATP